MPQIVENKALFDNYLKIKHYLLLKKHLCNGKK